MDRGASAHLITLPLVPAVRLSDACRFYNLFVNSLMIMGAKGVATLCTDWPPAAAESHLLPLFLPVADC
jgi:hypothetical protein